jgi:DNA-directed RNA polymerase subunit M/transcription elongation factor TFIIS
LFILIPLLGILNPYLSKDIINLNSKQANSKSTEMNPFEASFQSVTGVNSHSITSNSRAAPLVKNEQDNGALRSSNFNDSRRKSKSSSKDSGDEDNSDEDSDNGEDSEQKRQKFLERNRVAASKCRQKKKRWMQDLASQADEATQRNKQLHMMVSQLKEEVLTLKNQLLSHRNCNCNVIQQYLQSSGQFDQTGPHNVGQVAVTSTQIPMIPLQNANLPPQ